MIAIVLQCQFYRSQGWLVLMSFDGPATTKSPFFAEFSADYPENEDGRIQKLLSYRILDTAPETAYDDLTALAAHICGTAVSLVSLVDVSKQWIKSRVGIEITETSRNIAFCAHAILNRGVMIVPDTHKDARFVDNPLVTGAPYIRFYAGAPLITSDDYALGTLCVVDYEPKQLGEAQIKALEVLSRQVVSHLELRLSVLRIQRETTEKEKAQVALQQINVNLIAQAETTTQKNEKLTELLNELENHFLDSKKPLVDKTVGDIETKTDSPLDVLEGSIEGNVTLTQAYVTDLLRLLRLYQERFGDSDEAISLAMQKVDPAFVSEELTKLLAAM